MRKFKSTYPMFIYANKTLKILSTVEIIDIPQKVIQLWDEIITSKIHQNYPNSIPLISAFNSCIFSASCELQYEVEGIWYFNIPKYRPSLIYMPPHL